jgi:hypothetical protein
MRDIETGDGAVAQLGERLVRNEEVRGSIPLSSTIAQGAQLPDSLCWVCRGATRTDAIHGIALAMAWPRPAIGANQGPACSGHERHSEHGRIDPRASGRRSSRDDADVASVSTGFSRAAGPSQASGLAQVSGMSRRLVTRPVQGARTRGFSHRTYEDCFSVILG